MGQLFLRPLSRCEGVRHPCHAQPQCRPELHKPHVNVCIRIKITKLALSLSQPLATVTVNERVFR